MKKPKKMLCRQHQLRIAYELKDKEYFLRYAMPCLIAKVMAHKLSEKEYNSLIKQFREGKDFSQEQLWKLFEYAMRKLLVISIEKNKIQGGKAIIDKETIKEYFWFKHPQAVLFKNTFVELCLVLPAKVIQKRGKKYFVETPLGSREIYAWEDLGIGDFVTVHYNYACEKIGEKDYSELKKFLDGVI